MTRLHEGKTTHNTRQYFNGEEFGNWTGIYHLYLTSTRSEEEMNKLNQIPAHILWLFKHSSQSTRASFGMFASAAYMRIQKGARNGYSMVTEIIVDQIVQDSFMAKDRTLQTIDNAEALEAYKFNF